MNVINYSAVQGDLAKTMNRVCDNHEPVVITRDNELAIVMLSLEDYRAPEETAFLLRSPANAMRLLSSIAQLNAGMGIERELSQ